MKQGDLFGGSAEPPKRERAASPTAKTPSAIAPIKPAPPALDLEPPVQAPLAPAQTKVTAPSSQATRTPAWRREQPPKKILSVSELTFAIKDDLEQQFGRVIVRGEVTGFRAPNSRGHLYFSIKDARAQLDVIVWQTHARSLKFQLRDGLSVIVEGPINVYEVQGRYSLIVERIEPEGVGARALAFEQLKAKLTKEGLIGEGRRQPKRPLPALPRRIGVVTSSSGAAWRDFLKVLHRRHPRVSVLFCNARVQGDDAPIEIARGVRWLGKTDVDVIVVTRGGGSAEDLWAFNEERVVRAIFDCPKPVVSAVGHEVDVTLADLVADFRAPTPSAAAEAVVPVLSELEHRLKMTRRRLSQAIERRVLEARHRLQAARGTLGDPRRQLSSRRLELSELSDRARRAAEKRVRGRRRQLETVESKLTRLRPQTQVIERRTALAVLGARLREALRKSDSAARQRFNRLRLNLERASPLPRLEASRRRMETARSRLRPVIDRKLERERRTLASLAARLDALSPLAVLARGYAIVTKAERVVRRSDEVTSGDLLTVRLDRGDALQVRVETTRRGSDEE